MKLTIFRSTIRGEGGSSLERSLALADRITSLLRSEPHLSRMEVAQGIELSPATVGRAVQNLIDAGSLTERVQASRTTGRPRMELRLNPRFAYALVADIAVESAVLGLVDYAGRLIFRKVLAQGMQDLRLAVDGLSKALAAVLQDLPPVASRLAGVGIAVTGTWNTAQHALVFTPNLPQWNGVDLTALFRSLPTGRLVIDNDTKAATLGEMTVGAARRLRNFLYVRASDFGIGSALVSNRTIVRGEDNMAGGIGHSLVSSDAGLPRCRCGRRGCLESLASLAVIEQQLAAGGDKAAVLQQSVDYLAPAIANLTNLFAPEAVVLGGTLFKTYPELYPALVQASRERVLSHIVHRFTFVPAEFEPHSALMGMAMEVFAHSPHHLGALMESAAGPVETPAVEEVER